MTLSSRMKSRSGLAVAICGVAGALAGIAGSAAAPSHNGKPSASERAPAGPGGRPHMDAGRGVHADVVSLNRAGTAFITETEDNGVLKSVAGNDITITEAAKSVTYKDVAITLPASATILRNGAGAKASDLKVGDHVHVSQSSDGANVFAADASFLPPGGGPHHFGAHDGPPPFGPPPGQ